MSETTAAADDEAVDAEAEGEDSSGKKKKLAGKKLVLFVILPALLLLILGGVGAVFMLSGGEEAEEAAGEGAGQEAAKETVFYDLPEMLVNLNTGNKRASYLKISVSLELESAKHIPQLEAVLPRVVDNFQVYLRELRLEDLSGSAGLVRLKEELLIRVNVAAGDVPIRDVLFKEMLVQ